MVPKMQTSVGIACFESYHSRSRLLLRSAASLLQTLSLPLPGALSSSRLSPPPRLPSLSPSLVLRPPLTVTGWLVDWLFLGGGREGDYRRQRPARSWPRPPRARPPPADSHFPHSFASKARSLPPVPPSVPRRGSSPSLRFVLAVGGRRGHGPRYEGHGGGKRIRADTFEGRDRCRSPRGAKTQGRIRYTQIRRYECR